LVFFHMDIDEISREIHRRMWSTVTTLF
jgi:hypothetical protein